MSSNRLKLNEEETQVIWLGTRQQLAKITVDTLILLCGMRQYSVGSLSETSASHSMANG